MPLTAVFLATALAAWLIHAHPPKGSTVNYDAIGKAAVVAAVLAHLWGRL